MRGHYDALDFDLFDRWRVRLHDVPLSIGWGAVALFLRHLPYDSETMRELDERAVWSGEQHTLTAMMDLIGDLFAADYEHIPRPGETKQFSTAEQVDDRSFDELLALFRHEGGVSNG